MSFGPTYKRKKKQPTRTPKSRVHTETNLYTRLPNFKTIINLSPIMIFNNVIYIRSPFCRRYTQTDSLSNTCKEIFKTSHRQWKFKMNRGLIIVTGWAQNWHLFFQQTQSLAQGSYSRFLCYRHGPDFIPPTTNRSTIYIVRFGIQLTQLLCFFLFLWFFSIVYPSCFTWYLPSNWVTRITSLSVGTEKWHNKPQTKSTHRAKIIITP